jgi:hypothetical protein
VIGAALLPEPCGFSVPWHVDPRLRSSLSPDRRDAWNDWLRQKAALLGRTLEESQRDCEQAEQSLSRLAIQSDPVIFQAAHETNYDQIPNDKTTEALDYYYARAAIGYKCGTTAFARGYFGPAEISFNESATYASRALNFSISRFNHLVHDYEALSDDYDKLAKDDAEERKLVDLADRVIQEDNIALSVADRALLSVPPSPITMPVFAPPTPMQPIELHCVTTTSDFGTSATAYTGCYPF